MYALLLHKPIHLYPACCALGECVVVDLHTGMSACVLQGTVRKAGDRVRVSAQLVDARDGRQLWSQNYDRELSAGNVFDIQDDIREQIVSTISDFHGVIYASVFDVEPSFESPGWTQLDFGAIELALHILYPNSAEPEAPLPHAGLNLEVDSIEELQADIERLGGELGVPVYDVLPFFTKEQENIWFYDTMHMSRLGHRVFAENLADTIIGA